MIRLLFPFLSILYIAGIFLLADSPFISSLSPFNPYSLLHIPLYGILTVLLIFSLIQKRSYTFELSTLNFKQILLAGLIALGVAIADEIYQGYIPHRNASIIDIFIDFIGISLALIIFPAISKQNKFAK